MDADGDGGGLRVLVVGGGLAGMALAGFLRHRGLEPTVVERTEEWGRVGYGLGLWGNGLRILDRLGVAGSVAERGNPLTDFQVRAAGGDLLAEHSLRRDDHRPFVAVHRADLHAALREAVPQEWVRMGTTPTRVDERPGGVAVELDDGTDREFDVVVGADGIDSTVRERRFTDWTVEDRSTVVWSFWAPEGASVPDATTDVWAPGTEAFVTHVAGRGLVNVGTNAPPGRTPGPPARGLLADAAADLGWLLPDLVSALDGDDDLFFDRNRTVSAGTWTTDRVALVGDAAHAVHPISGQGASLALEDAYVLADELADAPPDAPAAALARYESRRRDRVEKVRRQARLQEWTTFTTSEVVATLRDALVRYTPAFEWFVERQHRALVDDLFRRL